MPRELVSSRAGACPAFEATEVVLYTIALPVELFVEAALLSAVGLAGEAMPGTEFLELRAQLVAVETFVAHHHESRRVVEQFDNVIALVGLSFDEGELHGQASCIGERHDLGVAPASRLAHGLCGGSAFGIGCALMNPHMRAIDESDPVFDLPRQPGKHPPPEPLASPAPIPSIDRAPGAEALGQVSPRTCVAQPVEQGVKHHVQSCWRPTA